MERFGPLEEVAEGLAVGDPRRHALLLTPPGVVHLVQNEWRSAFDWSEIVLLSLDLKSSRHALAGWITQISYAALIAAVYDDPGFVPKDGSTAITDVDGVTISLPVSRHHFGGYWYRSLLSTQGMLNQFIRNPESRELLTDPGVVISMVRKVAKSKTPASPP